MPNLAATLTSFREGRLTFDRLADEVARLATATPQAAAEIQTTLETEYQSGRLPASIYFALRATLDDETRILCEEPDDETHRVATTGTPARTAPPVTAGGGPSVTPSFTGRIGPMTGGDITRIDSASAPNPEVGAVLKERFVLEQLIGVGGMGMVFKALDLRKVEANDKEPYVALKVLNRDFRENPVALVALQRETKRAQTLSHPNVINVYDFDRDGAQVFMSMEYLNGRPLNHLIREHEAGLPLNQAWPIIEAMADALGHAHKKNIVHSDFKPGNVFIDDDGDVKVLDFGIACAAGRRDTKSADATVFDARSLGALTPAYASLEQLQNRDPDPRDDIYALGCVTYELLAGKHPFGRLSAEKALEVGLQPKPIPGLNRRQWKGLQRALAFRQDERTPSIKAFLSDLKPRTSLFYGAWAGALVVVGLVGANVYLSLFAPPVAEAPRLIVPLTAEQQQKVKDMLELAAIHFDVGYLTAPTGSNALWAYREALKIDPYNQTAIDGIKKIADTLEQQAWEAFEQGNRPESLKKVLAGLEADPSHAGLLKLQEKLRN